MASCRRPQVAPRTCGQFSPMGREDVFYNSLRNKFPSLADCPFADLTLLLAMGDLYLIALSAFSVQGVGLHLIRAVAPIVLSGTCVIVSSAIHCKLHRQTNRAKNLQRDCDTPKPFETSFLANATPSPSDFPAFFTALLSKSNC